MQNLPTKNIRELIESDFVTEPTRRALKERLNAEREIEPRFFDESQFEILKAVCGALAPSKVVPNWFVAQEIDRRLTENAGNGWRYDEMPGDGEAFKVGLSLFDDSARRIFQNNFAALEIEQRRDILKRFESDDEIKTQSRFSPARFLEELCAESGEIFYSHPLALEEIGYIGFADKHGWNLGVQSEQFKVQSRENELRMTNDELRENEIQNSEFESANPKCKIQNPKSKIGRG